MHEVVGYDPDSDEMVFEFEIPREYLDAAAKAAGVGSEDPEITGSYPLDRGQVRDIVGLVLKRKVDVPELSFFLEPFAEPGELDGQSGASGR